MAKWKMESTDTGGGLGEWLSVLALTGGGLGEWLSAGFGRLARSRICHLPVLSA